jgi:serine protease
MIGIKVAAGLCVTAGLLCQPARAQQQSTDDQSPRMALGLIVKLKDAKPQSVVRRAASRVSGETAQQLRMHMAAVAQRKRISYLVQRPTAFAATVIHPGYVTSLADAQAQAARLRTDPDVEWVIVNEIEKPQAVYPSHPFSSLPGTSAQAWLQPATSYPGAGNIEPAWAKLTDGRTLSPVVVAVLDTGILPHPSLAGRYLPGYDFVYRSVLSNDGDGLDADATDPGDALTQEFINAHTDVFTGRVGECGNTPTRNSWHGVEVAGVLAGKLPGQAGVMAPLGDPDGNAPVILPVRVSGKCGAEVSSIIEGMLWSANVPYQGAPSASINAHPAARVINLSYGGNGNCPTSDPTDAGWLYTQTIAVLKTQGVLVVASAGNGNGSIGNATPTRPASCADVLAVTGLNMRGYKARYANLMASGVAVASGDVDSDGYFVDAGIVTTTYDLQSAPGAYGMNAVAGTSFAAPQAAGVAAMMLAVNPNLSVDELLQGIRESKADHVASPNLAGIAVADRPTAVCTSSNRAACICTTTTCGWGVLDAAAAVDWAANPAHAGSFTGPAAVSVSTTSYFTPARESSGTVASSGGGGGGAIDGLSLLALGGMAAAAAYSSQRARKRQQRV